MEGNLQSVLKVERMEVTQNRGLTLVQLMFYLTLMMKLLKILDSVPHYPYTQGRTHGTLLLVDP